MQGVWFSGEDIVIDTKDNCYRKPVSEIQIIIYPKTPKPLNSPIRLNYVSMDLLLINNSLITQNLFIQKHHLYA